MIALSTSCISAQAPDGEALVDSLVRLGVGAVELEYRISPKIYHQMKGPLKASGIRVTSVHNYFPFPDHISGLRPGGDVFSLSHPDKEIRRQAVRLTTHTIEQANDLEAVAVVLHCGCVEMSPDTGVLAKYLAEGRIESEAAGAFIQTRREERVRKRPPHVESLLFSLDRLLPIAERENIRLGLENRFHFHEVPGFDDFPLLFHEFNGAPIGYWHDTGHAHALERLGYVAPNAYLEHYGDHLIGVHLHDAVGLDDHLPPGTGEIDFKALAPFCDEGTIKVMELKPGTPIALIPEGFAALRSAMEVSE